MMINFRNAEGRVLPYALSSRSLTPSTSSFLDVVDFPVICIGVTLGLGILSIATAH